MAADDETTVDTPVPVGLPTSGLPVLQGLIDQLLPTVRDLLGKSGSALTYYIKSKYWVGYPNKFIAIKVQDVRNLDLAITMYGEPHQFPPAARRLRLRRARPGQSRFNIDDAALVPEALRLIRHAYELKLQRHK